MDKMNDTKESYNVTSASEVEAEEFQLITPGYFYKLIPFGYAKSRFSTRLGPRNTQRVCALIGGFSIYVSAYNLVSFGSVLGNPLLTALLSLNQGSSSHIAAKTGGMVCLNPFGMILGALLGGILSNNLGRTKAMSLGFLLTLFGAAMQTSAQNITWLSINRVSMACIVPSWIGELSATGVRGGAIATELVFAGMGVCSATWIAYGFNHVTNYQFAWRFPVGFQMIFTIVLFCIIHFLPESPRWLVSVGRAGEASNILRYMHGDALAAHELSAIEESCRDQREHGASLSYTSMLFGKHNIRRRIFLAVLIQFTGTFILAYGMILSYSSTVFGFAGYSESKITLIASGNSISYLAFFFVGPYFCDKVSGRTILLIGSIGGGVMMCVIGGISKVIIKSSGDTSSLGAALCFCMYLYAAFHASSYATIAWVIPVEIFPQASRSRGGAISIVAFAFGNGLSTLIAPYLFNAIHENIFFLFGGLTLGTVPLLYSVLPYTAGRSLEDLNVLLSGPWLYWRAEEHYRTAKAAGRIDA